MAHFIVNAGFERRRPGKPGRKIMYESRNVQGIVIDDLEWPRDEKKVREKVRQHAPGSDWNLTGYVIV